MEEVATMLRQQQAEIEALKERLEETRQLYIKELALQRLSDIGQAIIGDSWISCIACGQRVTGDSKHTCLPKLRDLTEEEIDEVWVETCSDFKLIENGKTKGIINIYDVSRAIIKKAREK
jgi:hypothetical protein